MWGGCHEGRVNDRRLQRHRLVSTNLYKSPGKSQDERDKCLYRVVVELESHTQRTRPSGNECEWRRWHNERDTKEITTERPDLGRPVGTNERVSM